MSNFTKARLDAAIKEAERFGDEIDAKMRRNGFTPTADDLRELQDRIDAVKSARDAHRNAEAGEDAKRALTDAKSFMAALSGTGYPSSAAAPGTKGFLRLNSKGAQSAMREKDTKALVSSGFSFGNTITTEPIAAGMPASSILDVIPTEVMDGRTYTYLRQTTRTNNAAPVAAGAAKPVSVYTLEPITGELRIIAHLSEPLNTYDLVDYASLNTFIDNEMRYGLALAVTNQIINGTGTAPQIRGIDNVVGTQSQAWVTDRILTCRAALTKLETIGLSGAAYVLHPNDWESIETQRATGGEYLLEAAGAPIDRVERRLWGVRVVTDVAVAAGVGWLIADDSLVLRTDGAVRVDWAPADDDFTKNLVRARTESRFDLQVNRPLGLVELDLTA